MHECLCIIRTGRVNIKQAEFLKEGKLCQLCTASIYHRGLTAVSASISLSAVVVFRSAAWMNRCWSQPLTAAGSYQRRVTAQCLTRNERFLRQVISCCRKPCHLISCVPASHLSFIPPPTHTHYPVPSTVHNAFRHVLPTRQPSPSLCLVQSTNSFCSV